MKFTFQLAIIMALFSSLTVTAQDSSFEQDIETMLELNGSAKTYDMVYDQMLMQLKMTMPDVSDSVWAIVKTDVFDGQVKSLTKQLAPIYQKHFTHADIKAINAFYQTEAGKNMADKTPAIMQESMVVGQQWGMSLNMAIQQYLRDNGYLESNLLNK